MIDVNKFYPFDRNITELQRKQMSLPDKLRGIADRELAQFAFNAWLASNPETAKRYEHNPQHWNGT